MRHGSIHGPEKGENSPGLARAYRTHPLNNSGSRGIADPSPSSASLDHSRLSPERHPACIPPANWRACSVNLKAALKDGRPRPPLHHCAAISSVTIVPCKTTRIRTVGLSAPRSEEHTSELQSLLRISYAV